MKTIIYLLFNGFKLFFILLGAMLSKRIFLYYWNKYPKVVEQPNLFNLCVNWLYFVGNKTGLNYEQVNILIFCIIWPVITIVSILLNVLLIIKSI